MCGCVTWVVQPRDSMPAHRLFTDKDGKATVKSVQMNNIQSVTLDGKSEDVSVFRSYNVHQKQKTRGRGLTTEPVGAILPGSPISIFIYQDKKDVIMGNTDTNEASLCEFSMAVMKIGVRSQDQCQTGYGISLKGIKSLPMLKPNTYGLYTQSSTYNDVQTIHSQTTKLLEIKKVATGDFTHDMDFVNLMIRKPDSPYVNEKPIVLIDLKKESCKSHSHEFNIHQNKTIVLDFQDPASLFNAHTFAVHLPEGVFTPNTNIMWIRDYYQFCVDARIASVTVLYNEYKIKNSEKMGCAQSDCLVAVDEEALFKGTGGKLVLSESIVACLGVQNEFIHSAIDFTATKLATDGTTGNTPRWNGWTVAMDKEKDTHQFCLLDTEKTRTMACSDGSCEGELEHASLVCQVYPGMSDKREIWSMFLCTAHAGKIVSVVGTGVQKIKPSSTQNLVKCPVIVGAYASHHMLLG